MEPRPIHFLSQACQGELVQGAGEMLFCGVSTDTRTLGAGQAFVALKGDRFDGHNYLEEACRLGASVLVVEGGAPVQAGPTYGVVRVPDTRVALGRLAAAWRSEFDLPVIAVGGSNGKTTTKELLAAVLSRRFNTLRSPASFNNDVGVPLTLLQLGRQHEVAVIEVGTNHPGEVASLVRIIQPQWGVITSLGREHLGHFGTLDRVAEEHGALAESLPKSGALFVNGDSPRIESVAARASAPVWRIGLGQGNAWRAGIHSLDPRGVEFDVEGPLPAWEGRYRVPIPGRHQVGNALLALAVGAQFGVSRAAATLALASPALPPHRMECWLKDGVWILDDAYNANADSMLAALRTLAELPCEGRRIAVLGEMAETGEHGPALHEEVGDFAARGGVDILLAVGPKARGIAAAASAAGLAEARTFAEAEAAAAAVLGLARAGDVVLVKASRAARLERVSEALRNRAQAA